MAFDPTRLYKVVLGFRDESRKSLEVLGINSDDAISEAISIAGRKPIWVSLEIV